MCDSRARLFRRIKHQIKNFRPLSFFVDTLVCMSRLETPGHIVAAAFGYGVFVLVIIALCLLVIGAIIFRMYYNKKNADSEPELDEEETL